MSEEFVNGCIQHRDTRHLRLYYDYMDIYSDNEYKAKIIRILETWTDHKRAEWYKINSDRVEQGQEVLEPDFWITMSYQQFRQFMRHTASEDTLKKALAELESSKHIKRRINPDFPYGPPQYLLNTKVIQATLNKLTTPSLVPELSPQEDTPPPGKNIPPQEITPTQGVEIPPGWGEKTRVGGKKNTPTLGGKFGTSNITTKNHLEDVIDSDKEESESEHNDKDTLASPHVDAAPPLPDFPLITYADCITYLKLRGISPQGDAVQVMVQARTLYVSDHLDLDFLNAETEHRLPAIPKAAIPPGGTSHDENRDASPGNVAVARDLGVPSPVPPPPAPPEVSPPRTKSATVVSPPPQVLVVSQQFSSLEEWKEAQEAFVETLRGIWKTAAPDFKKACGTWNIYRKQYLDRWLRANPMPGEVQFTQDGKALFDEWCSLFKVKVDAGKVTIEAANWLAERLAPWVDVLSIPRTDLLRDFKGWCYTNDKKGYYTRGVKLFDLRREFEGWQSYQQSLLDKAAPARPQNKYGTVSGLPRLEIDPEWLAAVEGR